MIEKDSDLSLGIPFDNLWFDLMLLNSCMYVLAKNSLINPAQPPKFAGEGLNMEQYCPAVIRSFHMRVQEICHWMCAGTRNDDQRATVLKFPGSHHGATTGNSTARADSCTAVTLCSRVNVAVRNMKHAVTWR